MNPDSHFTDGVSEIPVLQSGQTLDNLILAARGSRNVVDERHPYHVLVEPEYSAQGIVEDVLTVFLTNKECPFRCLMCDLWKNTTTESVAVGAIPAQIREALTQRAGARHIKLYNSGNFFDVQAIPQTDYQAIAALLTNFDTIVVENHPRLCTERCIRFQQMLDGQLEIAMGLESSDEETLKYLNKQMTTADFANACDFLRSHQIRIRSFVLLRPPGVTEAKGVEQAIESVRFAFDCGVECCAVIPTRSGNGIMDQLQQSGQFQPPSLRSLEKVLDETLSWNRGRVFADLWDAAKFGQCETCASQRISRLAAMNQTQTVGQPIDCPNCSNGVPYDSTI